MINNIRYNKGYDVYVVNDDGVIFILYKGQILQQYVRKSNTGRQYYIVNIPDHGEQYVHKLVAYAFYPDKYAGLAQKGIKPVVDHIDNNPFNNNPNNLQWVTRSENANRAVQFHKSKRP